MDELKGRLMVKKKKKEPVLSQIKVAAQNSKVVDTLDYVFGQELKKGMGELSAKGDSDCRIF